MGLSASFHTFKVLPRRWVVERTFGWIMKHRPKQALRAAAFRDSDCCQSCHQSD
jgi:transposase